MTKSMIVWIYVTYLCYLLQPVCTGTTYTSKACYGTSGLVCTRHDVICSNSNQKIAIYDGYYTNNTECTQTGLANCDNFSVDGVAELGYHRFNNTELVSLCKNCSTKVQCVFQGPRRGATRTFSVVKYQCIEGKDPFNVTCETVERTTERTGTSKLTTVNLVASTNVSTPSESTKIASTQCSLSTGTTDNSNNVAGQTENNTGAIAGGVVATVVAVLVVTLVSVWIIRHRRAKSEVKENTAAMSLDAMPDMTYSLASNTTRNNYHEIQDLKTHNSDYDYATADGIVLPPTTNTYFTIEPAGKLTVRDNSTASAAEGEYDHIGDKPSPQTSDYDTTASVAQPGNTGEDGYGYNHFQKKANPQTQQNDYDTAASATQAVAQLSTTERNTDEDDYDHFQRGTNASETPSSPYDTTSGVEHNPNYSVAGIMK